MDEATKGLASSILKELKGIHRLIHYAFSGPKQDETSAEEYAHQSKSRKDQASHGPFISAASEPDPSDSAHRNTHGKDKASFPKITEYKPLIELLTLILVAVYTAVTLFQWNASQEANRITRDTLILGQRSYVTIGRKDGIVAEFVSPKDPKENAGLLIYFENSGHLPARFNWGMLNDIVLVPPLADFPAVRSPHNFTPMKRTRNRKDGSQSEVGGGITIAGDSIYSADVVEMPQQRVERLSKLNRVFLVYGAFEYCDALGTHVCRQFQLFYQGTPYNSFRLVGESECAIPIRVPMAASKDEEILIPTCQTEADRAAQRQREDKSFQDVLSKK